MKLTYCLWAICMPILLHAQTNKTTITGYVHNAGTGAPITGVTVTFSHAALSVVTDNKGWFRLATATLPDTLSFFMVGYRAQSVPVTTDAPINILLEETSRTLDSVLVSTGYQRIPKERATGSFGLVNNELINRSVSTSVLSRIENTTPGVLFNKGDAANTDALLIRGRSTIYANAAPLIVLDNFPYDGDISNINPNDVESITILRDAAAASIWGARAGNGVIVITTKKGTTAAPKLVLNSNTTFMQKPDLFNIHSISSADYINLEKTLFEKGYYANDELYDSWNYGHPPLTPVVELLIAKRDGTMPAAEADALIESYKIQDARKDIANYLYRNGINQQHALNLSGNTPNISYYFSAGWDQNSSNLAGAANNRITLRTQNTFRVNSKLQIDAGISFIQSNSQQGNNPGYGLNSGYGKSLYPYARLVDDNEVPVALVKDHRLAFTTRAADAGLLNWQYNPINDIAENELKTSNTDYVLNAALRYNIMAGLQAELKYQYEQATVTSNDKHSEASYVARNLVNSFTQVDAATGTLSYPIPLGGIMDLTSSSLIAHQGRATLQYNRAWRNRHQLNVLAGWEIKDLQNSLNRNRLYGYNETRSSVETKVDYVSRYTQYYNIYQQATIPSPQIIHQTTDRFISSFVNAAYTFDNRYTISASARQDAANLFGVSANQRGTPLWSAGAAWIVSNEQFYQLNWLPLLKLRATYGSSGNISRLASAYTTVSFFTANLTPLTTATVISPPNAALRWEKLRMLNIGLDVATRKERLSGTIEYHRKKATDLLGQAPADPTLGLSDNSGSSFFYGNVASMKGSGVDISITSKNIQRGISWSTDWLFSYAASRITEYLLPSSNAGSIYLQANSFYINPVKGRPVYGIYSYPWAGLDPATGDPLGLLQGKTSTDYNAITQQSIDSIHYHGPAQPVYFGAVRNSFKWKQFSFSFNISYKLGYYFRRPSINYDALYRTWNGHSDYALRWQQPGDEAHTSVPSLVYPANPQRDLFYQYASVLVDKADNIRLEDISIAYDIDKARWKALPFKHLRVYAYAANLALLYTANKQHIDPYYNNPRQTANGIRWV